jgi:tRNA pseudouridine55 synthase
LSAAHDRSSGPGLDGILVIAKPAGPTSHDVVALVRRLAATRRVGHGGTLDPFASGVLPVFLGRATRVVEYHLADRKAYRATVCFGATSSTDDLEGELVPVEGRPPDRGAVQAALGRFLGRISQTPPAYSAVKVSGRRAYALARAGQAVELTAREVEIDGLELVDWDGTEPDRPVAVIEVRCSAGTYIRALARDLGAALGTGAYLGALVRTASGPFTLASAIPLDAVRAAAADDGSGVRSLLLPIDAGLDRFPTVVLSESELAAVARGQLIRPLAPLPPDADSGAVRLLGPDGALVAFATVRAGRLAPDKVLVAAPAGTGPAAASLRSADERESALLAELDPPTSVDPDPATPDG